MSNLKQVSVISSQRLTSTLLNPLELIPLLVKLDTQLVSHPRLALPNWNGENMWYMHKLMKLQSFMMLNIALHITLVDKSLQFHLFRIHNIPWLYPIIKKSFRYSIQEEYLAIT